MVNEKKDLEKLLRLISKMDNHLYEMQNRETAFVINDRLYDHLDEQSLFEWFDSVTDPIVHEASKRILELKE